MPYITQDRRDFLDPHINALVTAMNKMGAGMGDLNYTITRIALGMGAESYAEMSAVRAVFHDAHDEFYQRQFVDYEKLKRDQNGDVY